LKVDNGIIENNLYQLFDDVEGNDNIRVSHLDSIQYCHTDSSAWPNLAYTTATSINPKDLLTLSDQIVQSKAPRTLLIGAKHLDPSFQNILADSRFMPAGRWVNMYSRLQNSDPVTHEHELISELAVDDLKGLDTWTRIVSEVLFSKKPLDRNIFKNGLSKGYFKLFLTTVDGIGVCTGLLYLGSIEPGVYMIATIPDYRKKGYAKRLMQVIMKAAYQLNKETIVLHSTPEGAALYESLGFEKTGSLFLYYSIIK
jgi:GNAT superfamily N-acetyltransferase